MFKWLTGLKGLICEWYAPGEKESADRLRMLFSNYNANIIAQLIGGSFWTGMLLLMNADDSFVGTAAMIPYLSYTLQLLSPLLFERFQRRKALIITFRVIYYVVQTAVIALLPLLPMEGQGRLSLLLIFLLLSSGLFALQNPAANVWMLQSLPERVRPAYYSTVNITVNLVCAAVPLLGGRLVDSFKERGMEYEGLLILRLIALALVIFDAALYIGIKEYPYEGSGEKFRIKELILLPLGERRYRMTVLAACIDSFVVCIPGQYHLLYLLNDVQVNYSFISGVNFAVMLVTSLSVIWWKPVLQRWGWMKTYGCGCMLYMVFLIGIAFVQKGTQWIYPVFAILNASCAAPARGLAGAGLPYHNIPQKRRAVYLAAYLSLTNFAAMLGVCFGKYFVSRTGTARVCILGADMGSKQYMCVLAGLLCGVVGLIIMRMGRAEKSPAPGEAQPAAGAPV